MKFKAKTLAAGGKWDHVYAVSNQWFILYLISNVPFSKRPQEKHTHVKQSQKRFPYTGGKSLRDQKCYSSAWDGGKVTVELLKKKLR